LDKTFVSIFSGQPMLPFY